MSYLPYTPPASIQPHAYYTNNLFADNSGPSPIYTLLILGLVMFMAANAMPMLVPAADRIWNVAPFFLQWGFFIVIIALMAQMIGLVPGVPQLHITYIHMTIAVLLFIVTWNQIVQPSIPAAEEKKSSSSSSSRETPREEKKEEKKKEESKPEEPSPWDDLRAHPSAFLTTRLNKLMPWPFPMGKATAVGKELWWEKGMPLHVGHFNKPDPELMKAAQEEEKKKKQEEEAKKKAKEKEKEKEKERAKEKEKAIEKEKAAKEAAIREKAKEEEAKRAKELEKKKAVEDKQRQKLWRTKYLVMIIGISFVNKILGFLLLLFFSLQIVSQELNKAVPPPSQPSSTPQHSSLSSSTSDSSSSSKEPSREDIEREKMARLRAMKEKEAAEKSKLEKSSSSSSSKPSSSSSSSQESSKSSSSSSNSKDAPIGSDAIRKAAGSTTVTKMDAGEDSGLGVLYNVGFGMHYVTNLDADGKKPEMPPMPIPSTGMSHPLMTTTHWQYAN
ncbi:hypothetical protein L204_100294 [Cryptococcus depauperatus]|nr:hypothetical protein L204_02226 [Cryptococcus depauperatus CBS 7855]